MNTIPQQIIGARLRRRIHSAEFKAQVVAACYHPGNSIAAVAMANGINANLARRWIVSAEQSANGSTRPAAGDRSGAQKLSFLPLTLPVTSPTPLPGSLPTASPAQHQPSSDIRIDLRRGTTSMAISWPTIAAAECAAWMRELLVEPRR